MFLLIKAEDIICILLTDKWLEMVPLMQVMCISSMAYVVANLHTNLFKAIGRTQILFVCELIKKILGILILLITFQYGLIVMVWGLLIYAVLNILVSSYFVYRFVGITLLEQGKEMYIVVFNSLISVLLCFIIGFFVDQLYMRFVLSIISYFVIYTLLAWFEKDKAIDFFKGYFKR